MDRRSFLALPILSLGSLSQDQRLDRDTRERAQRRLRGLRRIGVQVNVFGAIGQSLDLGRLQTRAELKLRELGVPIISGSIVPEPTLMFMIYSHEFAPGMFVVSQSAELIEPIVVPRAGNEVQFGRTWGGNPLLGSSMPSTAVADAEEAIIELAEWFANDYLGGNPRV